MNLGVEGLSPLPPAPWVLRGRALAVLRWVDVDLAQALVPDGMHIVPLLPGRTLSVLLCAHYGAGSTVEYDELIVSPGLVRSHARIAAWISGIWVDDGTSRAAGRSIWGLPKEFASFDWIGDAGAVHVRSGDGTMTCNLQANAGENRPGWPVPFAAPVWGRRGRLLTFLVHGHARIRSARGRCVLHDRDAGFDVDTATTVLRLERLMLRIGEGVPRRGPPPTPTG
jgi:hypothetical protein